MITLNLLVLFSSSFIFKTWRLPMFQYNPYRLSKTNVNIHVNLFRRKFADLILNY